VLVLFDGWNSFFRAASCPGAWTPHGRSVELVAADGSRSTLALLHAWVPNQGNVWTLAVQHLARELERAGTEATAAGRTQQGSARAAIAEGLLASVRLLGRRSADLHAALASRPGDPIFAPEPLRAADLQQWAAQARSALAATTTLLLPPHAATAPQAARLAVAGATLEHLAQCLSTVPVAGQRIRIHGAYCLQEVLLVNDDFVIVDFKGGAQRPASERRSKQSPLRDVATLLHSIDLARLAALQASPHSGAEQSRREARARDWADAMRGAFVDSYASCALAAGLWPDTATLTAQLPLCDLFETELAVAELGEALRQPGTDPATAWAALDALLARHGAA
jgi:maltose alpha-D-glucosyltransferase/alpha-amylase